MNLKQIAVLLAMIVLLAACGENIAPGVSNEELDPQINPDGTVNMYYQLTVGNGMTPWRSNRPKNPITKDYGATVTSWSTDNYAASRRATVLGGTNIRLTAYAEPNSGYGWLGCDSNGNNGSERTATEHYCYVTMDKNTRVGIAQRR